MKNKAKNYDDAPFLLIELPTDLNPSTNPSVIFFLLMA